MDEHDKPLVWLHGEVKTPPFSQEARIETGVFLRRLQQGENFGLPLKTNAQYWSALSRTAGSGCR